MKRAYFASLQTKIVLLITLIFALVAGSIIYFTKKDVGGAMLENQERSADVALNLLLLNLQGDYKALLFEKVSTIEARKNRLQTIAALARSVFAAYHDLSARGVMSAKKAETAALDWLAGLNRESMEVIVYNSDFRVRYYSGGHLSDKELSDVRDVKGRRLVEAAWEESLNYESGFAVFPWAGGGGRPSRMMFGHFIVMLEWDLALGVMIGVDDIEAETQRKLNGLLQIWREKLARISENGKAFTFLFNGKKEVLIQSGGLDDDVASQTNAFTGNALLDDVIAKRRQKPEGNCELLWMPAEMPERSGRPIADKTGIHAYIAYFKNLDWYIVLNIAERDIKIPADNVVNSQILIIACIFFLGVVITIPLVGRISKPLRTLAEYAKQIPEMNFTADAPLKSPIAGICKSRDEVGRLAESFEFMENELRKNIRELVETTATKERIQSELDVAKDIQMGILPERVFPAFPGRSDFDLYASLVPALEVGGDLYDYFLIDDCKLCFAVGDVSGKGVPAALFMAVTATLLKGAAGADVTPAEVMVKINDELVKKNPNSMFVTLFIGILDTRTGRLEFASGGHNPPVIIVYANGVYYKKDISGPMVGAMDDVPYRELALDLAGGDAIFVYTDGVTEAMNMDHELFSEERLMDILTEVGKKSAKEVVEHVGEEVRKFAGRAPQSDDITMLMLRYLGKSK